MSVVKHLSLDIIRFFANIQACLKFQRKVWVQDCISKDKEVRIFGCSSRALAKAEQKYHSLFVNNFQTILHMENRLKCIRTILIYHMYYHQQNLMQLENFNINIHYKPGRNNANADALSRFPENIKEHNKT